MLSLHDPSFFDIYIERLLGLYFSAKDEREVALCVKELNSPSFYPSMVSIWVTDSFERKDMERDLLANLLVSLNRSHDSLLTEGQLIKG